MNNSVKNIFIFMIIIAIIVCFVYLFNDNKKNEVDNNFNYFDVDIYLKEENIVTDYSTFYTIQQIVQNIISLLNDKQYDEVYKITSKEFKSHITKEEFNKKIEDYTNKNFNKSAYIIKDNLLFLYDMKNNKYIASVKTLTGKTNIGISLLDDTRFIITYFDIKE